MALIQTLEGVRGSTQLLGPFDCFGTFGVQPKATTLAGLYGTFDVFKAHPWMILFGLLAGGFYAASKAPHGRGTSSIWGEHRMSHSRTKSLSGYRRRRR